MPVPQVMVDAERWLRALPYSIEAFFFLHGSREGEETARRIHSQFHEKFALGVADVPLLRFDPSKEQGALAYAL